MPEIPACLDDCSTTHCIAALLYLGWTHEEIATVTGVSKSTVQKRRDDLESGGLSPPPETFSLLRDRERQIHRASREAAVATDVVTEQIVDQLAAIVELKSLGFGPNEDFGYDDLKAFGALVAGQLDDATPQDAVDRLVEMAELADELPESSLTGLDRLKQRRAKLDALQGPVTELEQTDDPGSMASGTHTRQKAVPTTTSDNRNFPLSPENHNRDIMNRLSDPQPEADFHNISEKNLSRDKGMCLTDVDQEECRLRDWIFDSDRNICCLS